jgi:prepilin-type N-terminal cleavage/methylation domain-containing protein/prepilin-type processing-associated H-X9-DG protein
MKINHRGFTLIELLVVIAIIAILAAILFPVFTRAREKANQTTCSSNQRQIAATIQMYAQDHEETFFSDPVDKSWNAPFKSNEGNDIYDCPSKDGSGSTEYCFNMFLFGKSLGDIDDPSKALMTADANTSNPAKNYSMRDSGDIDGRHSNGCIVSCVDGHVAYDTLTGSSTKMVALVTRGYQFVIGNGNKVFEDTSTYSVYSTSYNRCNTILDMPDSCYGAVLPKAIRIEVDLRCDMPWATQHPHVEFTCFETGTGASSGADWQNSNVPYSNAITFGEGGGYFTGSGAFRIFLKSSAPKYLSYAPASGDTSWYRYVLNIINKKDVRFEVFDATGVKKLASLVTTEDLSGLMSNTANKKMTLYTSGPNNQNAYMKNIRIYIW